MTRIINFDDGFTSSNPPLTAGSSSVDLWATSTVYGVGALVIESNKFYRCIIAHTSGIFATDLSVLRWEIISDGSTDHTTLSNIGTNTHAQIDTAIANSVAHIANTSNPHSVTKVQVGLGSVDNTTDLGKPISTATQTALNLKVNTTGGSVITPTRLDVKQDTKANLTTYALTASNGQFVFATDTKEMLQVVDTLLVAVGSGSGGTSELESGFLSMLTFTDSVVGDFTQTGLAISTANPIRGVKSAQLISAGSTQSFKKVLAVDPEFRGKNSTISIYTRSSATQGNVTILIYDETNAANLAASQPITLGSTTITATTTSASATLSAISTTDINLLKVGQTITGAGIPAGTIISAIGTSTATMSQNASASATITPKISALPARQAFTFDIPNNCASLSYTISALAETGSPESYFDDITIKLTERVGTTASVTVPKNNDYSRIAYTPTFTGFGTVTGIEVFHSREGEFLVLEGKFTAGTVTGVEARVSLPDSLSRSSLGSLNIYGEFYRGAVNTNEMTVIVEPSVPYITFSSNTVTTNPQVKALANTVLNSSEIGFFKARIPIQGWSANETESLTIPLTSSQLVQTPDSYLRITGFNAAATGSVATKIASIASGTIQKNIGDALQYLDDSSNGARFVALKSGLFRFQYTADSNNTAASTGYGFSLNSVNLTTAYSSIPNSEKIAGGFDTSSAVGGVFGEAHLNIGDIIRIHRDGGATSGADTAWSSFTASYSGALSQLNFSTDSKIVIPTHQLRFEGASSRGSTDTAIVKFDTQAITQGDAWSVVNTAANGTVITMQKAGKLSISGSIQTPDSTVQVTLNQLTLTALSSTASEILVASANAATRQKPFAWTNDVKVGDKIRVACDGVPGATANNNLSLSLTESSIPANFSNVLPPQWSQSDSSVEVNTANSYGSVATLARRFSNNPTNLGTAFTYIDSPTLGAQFIANEDTAVNISYIDSGSIAVDIYIRINGVIKSSSSAPNSGNRANAVYVGSLSKGDIVTFTTGSATVPSFAPAETRAMISKVGKPNLSSVDVTSFVNMKTTDTEAIYAKTSTSAVINGTAEAQFTIGGISTTNKGIIQIQDDTPNTRTKFVALKDCVVNVSYSAIQGSSGQEAAIYKNGVVFQTSNSSAGAGAYVTVDASLPLIAGEFITVGAIAGSVSNYYLSITATADNNATASPTQQVSSDTMSFVFKATAIDPNVDPVGTFNTYTYGGGNTTAISASAPTQATSSMNVNGIFITARSFGVTLGSATPARFDIFLGKGLKSKQVDAYVNLAKANAMMIDRLTTATLETGTTVHYNETTGVLTLDAGAAILGGVTRTVGYDIPTQGLQPSGYFVFNASKAPVLTTVPNLQMRVAYLSDVKATTVNGGASIAATWTTRELNTIVDNTGIVTSLASNQFVLPAGTYNIEASAPFFSTTTSKLRLRNITDSTTYDVSDSLYANTTTSCSPIIRTEITLTSAKTLALQYYVGAAVATNGLGTAVGGGENEKYSTVKITKIK